LEEDMSFQAYLDTITAKTGMSIDQLLAIARDKGFDSPLAKAGDVVTWFSDDYGLGRGHAMAIVRLLKDQANPVTKNDKVDAVFAGPRDRWRPSYDAILERAKGWGDDVAVAPTDTYVSLTRNGRKFAIVQPTGDRLDLGIKRKGVDAAGRFEAAGSWNSMVTHRVRITDPAQLDAEVFDWLEAAYEAN
jgi:hypothetical protein